MKEKKTIKINSKLLKTLIISTLISFLIIFGIEHFGKFNYTYNQTLSDYEDKGDYFVETYSYDRDSNVLSITLNTPFGNQMKVDRSNWKIKDLEFSDGDFYNYPNKFKNYLRATAKTDILYVLLLSLCFWIIIFISKNFKIKLT